MPSHFSRFSSPSGNPDKSHHLLRVKGLQVVDGDWGVVVVVVVVVVALVVVHLDQSLYGEGLSQSVLLPIGFLDARTLPLHSVAPQPQPASLQLHFRRDRKDWLLRNLFCLVMMRTPEFGWLLFAAAAVAVVAAVAVEETVLAAVAEIKNNGHGHGAQNIRHKDSIVRLILSYIFSRIIRLIQAAHVLAFQRCVNLRVFISDFSFSSEILFLSSSFTVPRLYPDWINYVVFIPFTLRRWKPGYRNIHLPEYFLRRRPGWRWVPRAADGA